MSVAKDAKERPTNREVVKEEHDSGLAASSSRLIACFELGARDFAG